MSVLVQKVIVESAEKASPLLPAHVAVVSGDGGPLLGTVTKLGTDASTVAAVRDAYNALVDTLVDAGLAKVAEEVSE